MTLVSRVVLRVVARSRGMAQGQEDCFIEAKGIAFQYFTGKPDEAKPVPMPTTLTARYGGPVCNGMVGDV